MTAKNHIYNPETKSHYSVRKPKTRKCPHYGCEGVMVFHRWSKIEPRKRGSPRGVFVCPVCGARC
ncbi:MAG: hypothetical protein ACXQS4_02505 [Methermicoccaceae archaeon]